VTHGFDTANDDEEDNGAK
jgi:hypothetical protein